MLYDDAMPEGGGCGCRLSHARVVTAIAGTMGAQSYVAAVTRRRARAAAYSLYAQPPTIDDVSKRNPPLSEPQLSAPVLEQGGGKGRGSPCVTLGMPGVGYSAH